MRAYQQGGHKASWEKRCQLMAKSCPRDRTEPAVCYVMLLSNMTYPYCTMLMSTHANFWWDNKNLLQWRFAKNSTSLVPLAVLASFLLGYLSPDFSDFSMVWNKILSIPRIIKHFVGELSGIALFNSTCAPHTLIIPLMVSPPKKRKKKSNVFCMLKIKWFHGVLRSFILSPGLFFALYFATPWTCSYSWWRGFSYKPPLPKKAKPNVNEDNLEKRNRKMQKSIQSIMEDPVWLARMLHREQWRYNVLLYL